MTDDSATPSSGEIAPGVSMWNGVCLSTHVRPKSGASRGGDWCEVFELAGDVVALSIGDVSGHGDAAHPLMAAVRDVVRRAAARGYDPARTLAVANAFVGATGGGTFATACFALFDTRRGHVTYANAGHPPPLVVDTAGSRFLGSPNADLPLGVEIQFAYRLRTLALPPRSLLVLYTDGVVEHAREYERGCAQLRAAATLAWAHDVPPTASRVDSLVFRRDEPDDAALLVAWTGRAPDRIASAAGASRRATATGPGFRAGIAREGAELPPTPRRPVRAV